MKTYLRAWSVTLLSISLSLAASKAAAQAVTGSGTVNTIPRFTAASVIGNSVLTQSGTRIGLGIAAPLRQFHLQTPAGPGWDGVRISHAGPEACVLDLFNSSVGGRNWSVRSNGSATFGGVGNFSIYDNTSGSVRFTIAAATGYVGLGTTAPLAPLHLIGTMPAATSLAAAQDQQMVKVEYSAAPGAFYFAGAGIQSNLNLRWDNGSHYSGCAAVRGKVNWACPSGGVIDALEESVAGVWGEASGALGVGVYGRYTNPCGASVGGYAGYFDGKVYTTQTYNSSDRKLKQHIEPLASGLSLLMRLKPMQYSFRAKEFEHMNLPSGTHMGFIAQDIQELLPELVAEASSPILDETGAVNGSTKFMAVNYTEIIPLLTAAMQEQQRKIEELEARLLDQSRAIVELSACLDKGGPGFGFLELAPNPASDQVTVRVSLVESGSKGTLSLLDGTGRAVLVERVQGAGVQTVMLSIAQLVNGTYTCELEVDGKVKATRRLVVQR